MCFGKALNAYNITVRFIQTLSKEVKKKHKYLAFSLQYHSTINPEYN